MFIFKPSNVVAKSTAFYAAKHSLISKIFNSGPKHITITPDIFIGAFAYALASCKVNTDNLNINKLFGGMNDDLSINPYVSVGILNDKIDIDYIDSAYTYSEYHIPSVTTLAKIDKDIVGNTQEFFNSLFMHSKLAKANGGLKYNIYRYCVDSKIDLCEKVFNGFDLSNIKEAMRRIKAVQYMSYVYTVELYRTNLNVIIIDGTEIMMPKLNDLERAIFLWIIKFEKDSYIPLWRYE